MKARFENLARYPVADETDLFRRECEATVDNIREASYGLISDSAPEDWAEQSLSWFRDNDPRAVEPMDGGGGYPTETQMRKCLLALGWLDGDSDDEEQA